MQAAAPMWLLSNDSESGGNKSWATSKTFLASVSGLYFFFVSPPVVWVSSLLFLISSGGFSPCASCLASHSPSSVIVFAFPLFVSLSCYPGVPSPEPCSVFAPVFVDSACLFFSFFFCKFRLLPWLFSHVLELPLWSKSFDPRYFFFRAYPANILLNFFIHHRWVSPKPVLCYFLGNGMRPRSQAPRSGVKPINLSCLLFKY